VQAHASTTQVRIALIGETAADVRDVMVEGESGILAIAPPEHRPHYEPSKRRLTWPNGSTATTYSGDAPEQLRGPQHHYAWADEVCKWKYPETTWDNIETVFTPDEEKITFYITNINTELKEDYLIVYEQMGAKITINGTNILDIACTNIICKADILRVYNFISRLFYLYYIKFYLFSQKNRAVVSWSEKFFE